MSIPGDWVHATGEYQRGHKLPKSRMSDFLKIGLGLFGGGSALL